MHTGNHDMFTQFHHRGWHYALLIGAGLGLFLINLGGATLWDLDEGRNAGCSLQMWAGENYLVPLFNSKLRVDKPVLLYWCQAAAYSVFGVSEFSARLPSALAALATMILCYELGRSLFGKTTGFLAGLIAGSTPMLCGAGHFANPDALLNFFVVLTLFFFWQCQRHGGWCFAAMGAACGLAVLAKGPVGVVLPFAIGGVYCLWTRQLRFLLHPGFLISLLVFLLVALPWYILVGVETRGDFLRGFLIGHNFERFNAPMENHRGNVLYYPLVLIVGTAPWSIFLGPTCLLAYRLVRTKAAETRKLKKAVAGTRFLTVWIGLFVLFFSLAATKLPNYILPVSVPFALLTAHLLVAWSRGEIRLPAWMLYSGLGFLVLTGVGLSVGLMIASGTWPMSFLRGRSYPGLERGAILGLLPLLGAALGWWFLAKGRRTALVWTVTLTSLAFVASLAAWGSSAFNAFKAPRPLVELAQAQQTTEDIEILCWQVEYLPSLNFYVRRDVRHLAAEELPSCLRYSKPVYLFLPVAEWEKLQAQAKPPCRELGRHYDLYHHEELVVITNRL